MVDVEHYIIVLNSSLCSLWKLVVLSPGSKVLLSFRLDVVLGLVAVLANGALTNVYCKQRFKHALVSSLFPCIFPFITRRASPVYSCPFSLGLRVNTWIWEDGDGSGRIAFGTCLIATKKQTGQLGSKTKTPQIFPIKPGVRRYPCGL